LELLPAQLLVLTSAVSAWPESISSVDESVDRSVSDGAGSSKTGFAGSIRVPGLKLLILAYVPKKLSTVECLLFEIQKQGYPFLLKKIHLIRCYGCYTS